MNKTFSSTSASLLHSNTIIFDVIISTLPYTTILYICYPKTSKLYVGENIIRMMLIRMTQFDNRQHLDRANAIIN